MMFSLFIAETIGPFIRGKIRRELYHLYEHVLSNKTRLILDEMCRLYRKFASYLRRVLCKTRLIFPCINGPNMLLYFTSKYTATAFLTEMFFPGVLNQVGKLWKFQGGGGGVWIFFWELRLITKYLRKCHIG